ncbi:MAG: hypothetical protein EOP42_20945 [Sphingobacteriaceae bacterium]|nr:MAG: hypothetical protein EOP42_20945 [Sphingobacteriaceae bacterium]
MTEISTNEPDVVKSLSTDQQSPEDDLEPHEKHFYKLLSLQLNLLQLQPKKETILKIITYSRSKK